MGFFDKRLEGFFKTNSNGEILFFPLGIMTRGYVVPSEEMKASIKNGWCRRFQRITFLILFLGFPIGFFMGSVGAYWLISVVLGIYIATYILSVKKVTHGLQRSDERMNWRALYEQLGNQMSWPILILLSLIGIGSMAAFGILAFISDLKSGHLIPIGILVVCVPLYYLAIRYKLRKSR